jgi:lactoylglutathione lyase
MLSCERYALPTVHVHHSWMLSQLLRKRDIPDEKYTNAFLGFGPEDKNFAVELTYNYGVESYDIGAGFGHFGIATTDVYKMCDSIKADGGKVHSLWLLPKATPQLQRS